MLSQEGDCETVSEDAVCLTEEGKIAYKDYTERIEGFLKEF